MITDYEALLAVGKPWPTDDADIVTRQALYAKNKYLFCSEHSSVWVDAIRQLRDDRQTDLRIILNFPKLLSTLWADLVVGETPPASAGKKSLTGQESLEQLALDRIIEANSLWTRIHDAVQDCSKNGTAVLKVRFDRKGIIEVVPPKYWYPIVSQANIKEITAHVLAYAFVDTDPKVKYSWLKVEIHTIGQIEHRLYKVEEGKIKERADLATFSAFAGLQDIESTGLDDFAVIDIQNAAESDELFGRDDYTDISSIVKELELRYAQICRIEDKFADPWMYGPPIEEQDPRDGDYKVTGGSRYIALTDKEQAVPGMIVWDGQLPANFLTIDSLMQRLYEVSETCKVAFDASQAGSALSGTALRLMMARPLSKSARLKSRFDPTVKRALTLCSKLEVIKKLPGAVELTNIRIPWQDGLPSDPLQEAQIDSTLVGGKVRSAQGRMREKGISEAQILQETKEMSDRVL